MSLRPFTTGQVLPPGTLVICVQCAVRRGLYPTEDAFFDADLVDADLVDDAGIVEETYLHVRTCTDCRLSQRPGCYMLLRPNGGS